MNTALRIGRLDQWVTQQAEQRDSAIAVVLGDDHLTYGGLEDLSNKVARRLIEGGCRQGDRIALLAPKSPAAIAAIVGIYKSGAMYVPLDPSGPSKRVSTLLALCDPRWILAAGPAGSLLEEIFADSRGDPHPRVGWLESELPTTVHFHPEFTRSDLDGLSAEHLGTPVAEDQPAHILFTSGSTGLPKGVVITHQNVIRFVEWAVQYFAITAEDRISGHPPLFFDLSVFDTFGAFAAGAALHLVPPELNMLPHALAEFIRTRALTQWFSVPSLLNYMAKFDVVRMHDFPSLKRVLWCGEVLPTPALMYWMQRLPHVQFTNLYGPTETTIASSYYTVPSTPEVETTPIPIGTPCPGEQMLVLDADLMPVPRGEVGELYIGGGGVSPGYWRDPDRTKSAFIPVPRTLSPHDRLYRTGDLAREDENGQFYFLGRRDSQIKSRGYRIELGEVETAVRALEGVAEAAVVAVATDGFEGKVICCGYVPSRGAALTPVALRAALSRMLPTYMLPLRWAAFDELPRTANGKIDRRQVSETFKDTAHHREAQAHR